MSEQQSTMDIPGNLDAWTYETVVEVVVKHDVESGRFEFKEALLPTKGTTPEWKAEQAASIRRTACSMANYDFGGFILFGVLDRKIAAATPKDRIVGIPRSDLRKELGDKLDPIRPEVYFEAEAIDIPGDATRCIFVVRIPTSTRRPHMLEDKFPIRGEGGKARFMSVDEVRSQMLFTEGRLRKVTLLRFELASILETCRLQSSPSTRSVRFETGAYRVLLAEICDMLPPDSGLLELLHGIGRNATILNYLVERHEETEFYNVSDLSLAPILREEVSNLRRDVPDKRGRLSNDCGKALTILTERFGPLPTA
jgi:hypothetical protein